jgi:acyl-CoA thioester hydrolase
MSTSEAPLAYPVKLHLRIDWSEMDLFGHVNNVSFAKYVQASRVNYWEAVDLVRYFQEERIGPILASTAIQFRKPLHYPGTITAQASISFIGNTSFGITHQLLNEQGEVAAEAQDVIVMFDFKSQKKVSFPKDIREEIEKLEDRKYS